ncbi:MAG: serine hydrolase [Ferruginibacter sp.]
MHKAGKGLFFGSVFLINAICCSPSKNASMTGQNSQDSSAREEQNNIALEDPFFINLFKLYPEWFDQVMAHKKDWNVQVIYTEINRKKNGEPELINHYFNTKDGAYFYPASTVKLPVALLALQKLNELKTAGINMNTPMLNLARYSGQSDVYNEPNSPDGNPTIANYIKKIFLVSDNDAFNRLYEFLGQEYINRELHKKGLSSAQILHRLDIFLSEDDNRHTNEIAFYDSSSQLVYQQPMQFNTVQYDKRNDALGKGYYSAGVLKEGPMNFSKKNRISLNDLHTILTGLIFPSAVKPSQRFNITNEDRNLVLQYMSMFPRESVFPAYDSSYQDAYSKFILMGAGKEPMPSGIRIFNKEGDAYGHMIDVAYVVDFDKKIEFMVSAMIYCNEDGILNDDKYDYETIGKPFMKNLGQAIYNYELNRPKKLQPDLSSFKFNYGK